MANDQSTTAVPAPAEPQVSATAVPTQPVAPVAAEHAMTGPDVLPDLHDMIGEDATSEVSNTGGTTPGKGFEPTGLITSRP